MTHKHDQDQLLARLLKLPGWQVVLTSKHLQIRGPGGFMCFAGRTPSDHRNLLNLRATLRRAGAEL